MEDQQFDYLVIGAGSAGNVIARRLLDAGKRVAVLEAGEQDTNPDIANVCTLGALWHSQQDWDYHTTAQEGASGRSLHLPRGKVMGGSHALNATIWVRGARQDYDTWAYLGCPGWSWDDVLPLFKKIETYDGGASETRGGDGLLDVSTGYDHNPIQQSMLDGAVEAGFDLNEDYNSGNPEGVSRMQLNVRDGRRFNTWHAYLKPVVDHRNLTLLTGARVWRLVIEDGAVVGVEAQHDGGTSVLRAGETILAAGAINSPELLLRSGIGPADELAEVGIDVVRDLPGVGKNLQDHLLAPVIYSTGKPVPELTAAPAEVHLFAKSNPDVEVPDTQPIFFSVPMYSQGYARGEMSGADGGFSMLGGLVRPQSRGEIRLTGSGPEDPISIDVRALSEQADVDALVASVIHCRRIGRTAALAAWEPTEVYPGPEVADDELEQYVRDSVVTYHHQVGTCRMGLDAGAVVDPRTLRIHGLDGVRIADASIMPLVPTGNTNAPSVMIGERAAQVILGAEGAPTRATPAS